MPDSKPKTKTELKKELAAAKRKLAAEKTASAVARIPRARASKGVARARGAPSGRAARPARGPSSAPLATASTAASSSVVVVLPQMMAGVQFQQQAAKERATDNIKQEIDNRADEEDMARQAALDALNLPSVPRGFRRKPGDDDDPPDSDAGPSGPSGRGPNADFLDGVRGIMRDELGPYVQGIDRNIGGIKEKLENDAKFRVDEAALGAEEALRGNGDLARLMEQGASMRRLANGIDGLQRDQIGVGVRMQGLANALNGMGLGRLLAEQSPAQGAPAPATEAPAPATEAPAPAAEAPSVSQRVRDMEARIAADKARIDAANERIARDFEEFGVPDPAAPGPSRVQEMEARIAADRAEIDAANERIARDFEEFGVPDPGPNYDAMFDD